MKKTKQPTGKSLNPHSKRISKFLSLILRHDPAAIGIQLDHAGWAEVDALLKGLAKHGYHISLTDLEQIVTENNKQRYCFNEDKTLIRANQGHSIKIDLQLTARIPPEVLYHGTATRFMASIQQHGIIKGKRHHVHLSTDKETARQVGSRHGAPVVLSIAAGAMHQDGIAFYCSDNGVWLVDTVPIKYFTQS